MLKLSKCRQRDRETYRTKHLIGGIRNERHGLCHFGTNNRVPMWTSRRGSIWGVGGSATPPSWNHLREPHFKIVWHHQGYFVCAIFGSLRSPVFIFKEWNSYIFQYTHLSESVKIRMFIQIISKRGNLHLFKILCLIIPSFFCQRKGLTSLLNLKKNFSCLSLMIKVLYLFVIKYWI